MDQRCPSVLVAVQLRLGRGEQSGGGGDGGGDDDNRSAQVLALSPRLIFVRGSALLVSARVKVSAVGAPEPRPRGGEGVAAPPPGVR